MATRGRPKTADVFKDEEALRKRRAVLAEHAAVLEREVQPYHGRVSSRKPDRRPGAAPRARNLDPAQRRRRGRRVYTASRR